MNNEVGVGSRDAAFGEDNSASDGAYAVRVPKRVHLRDQRTEGQMYNVHKDVITRFEVLPERVLLQFFRMIYLSMALGAMALIGLAVLKVEGRLENSRNAEVYSYVNVTAGAVCFVTMLSCTVSYVVRVTEVTRRGFQWSSRRKKMAVFSLAQYVAQTMNTLLYLVPNIIFLRVESIEDIAILEWMSFCRISLWLFIFLLFVLFSRCLSPWVDFKNRGIGREDAVLLDAPWAHHWPIFLLWAIVQGVIIMVYVYLHDTRSGFVHPNGVSYTPCELPSIVLFLGGIITGSIFLFQMTGMLLIYQAYCRLLKKPYNLYRGINLAVRYHFLNAGLVGDFVFVSICIGFWVDYNSCSSGNLTVLGLLPPQLAMTVLSAVDCIMCMPVKPGRTITLSLPVDNLEWLETREEATTQQHKEARTTPSGSFKFCFELSVKLWYWSLAVYAFDPATQECHDPQYPLLSFPVAMSMFGFQHHEFIAEKGSDTRILMAWNDHTILVCFRGTYSATNVWSDLQFWRVVHPPKRGSYFMRSQPLVHRGFLACWEHSQLNHRIVSLVRRIMDGAKFDRSRLRVLVTGHSLGGALAVLASHELATSCGIGSQITCYTYGAPRVGNHAFVREYNVLVPNTWQVINDVDLIPSVPKFVLLFKHVGERVIINGAGDMIVRPHVVEVSLYRMYGYLKRSIRIMHHLLLSYRASFVAICEAQYKHGKALEGGMEAMEILLKKREKLLSSGLNVDPSRLQDLHRLGSQVWIKKSFLVGKENG